MKNTFITVLILAIAFLTWKQFVQPVKETNAKEKYAQSFEYKDTKRVGELKDEVETLRVKALRLQAALDSCKYDIKEEVAVSSKVVYKTNKSSKALDDCTKELMDTKAKLGEYIGAKAQMEVEKDLEINKLKRQMDTCVYFVQEMDKALLKMSNDVTTLTNERDSLKNILETPIRTSKELPCLKVKKGAVLEGLIVPSNKHISMGVLPLDKDKYKAAKKSCKRITR